MKKVIAYSVMFLVLISLVLVGCAQPAPSPSTSKPAVPGSTQTSSPATTAGSAAIKLKFSHDQPPGQGPCAGWEWWAAEVGKRTNGRVTVDVYPGATLFAMTAAVDSIAKGVADYGNVAVSVFDQRFPLSNITGMPCLGFPDTKEGLLIAGDSFMSLYEKSPEVKAEWKDFKVLLYHPLLNYIIVSKKKEIHTPADIKGLRVGAVGLHQKFVELLGGAPVQMPAPQVYESLDKGVVDAAFISWSATDSFKITEVAKYYTDFGFGAGGQTIIMNLNSWNKISAGDQKIMMDLAQESRPISINAVMTAVDRAKQAVTKTGGKRIQLTAEEITSWKKAAEPIWANWVSQRNAQGSTSAQQILDEWKNSVAKAW